MAKINTEYIHFILEQFEKTFEEKLYDVYVGHKKTSDDDKDVKIYTAKPEEWEQVIDTLLEKGVNLEEYELCSKIQGLKPKVLEEAKKRLEQKENID